jgi:hypothetical protein
VLFTKKAATAKSRNLLIQGIIAQLATQWLLGTANIFPRKS